MESLSHSNCGKARTPPTKFMHAQRLLLVDVALEGVCVLFSAQGPCVNTHTHNMRHTARLRLITSQTNTHTAQFRSITSHSAHALTCDAAHSKHCAPSKQHKHRGCAWDLQAFTASCQQHSHTHRRAYRWWACPAAPLHQRGLRVSQRTAACLQMTAHDTQRRETRGVS